MTTRLSAFILLLAFAIACNGSGPADTVQQPPPTAPVVERPVASPTAMPASTATLLPTSTRPQPSPTPTLAPTPEAEAQETNQVVWTVSDDLVAFVDVHRDWEEDAELMATYANREDLDALFLRSVADSGLPAMLIYRLPRLDDAKIEANVSEFLEPSDERKGQHTLDGEIGGVAVVVMASVSVSERCGNERVVRAFAQLEGDYTWMVACYALEFDTGQHADCDAALTSVRIAPESSARSLSTVTPVAIERTAKSELAAKYTEAREWLDEARSPDLTWSDGSNWRDGVSDRLPELPLAPGVEVTEGMTCAQWEALEIAVFPEGEGYGLSDWWQHPDSDEISERWKENLARAVYGNDQGAAAIRFIGAEFTVHCGERMREGSLGIQTASRRRLDQCRRRPPPSCLWPRRS